MAYDLKKIKFSTDAPTWEKAVGLYDQGKITKFQSEPFGYSAVVIGTHPYHVSVSSRRFDEGDCECYLGQNDTICKHMVAVAIYALQDGKALTRDDKQQHNQVACSGRIGGLEKTELAEVKKSITAAARYIKSYEGPSKTWFRYQDSLAEGCNRLAEIVSALPVSPQTASLLVELLLRLDEKLCRGGVDDSDGTVGGFMESVVGVLKVFAQLDPKVISIFRDLKNRETSFGWEEPLLKLLKSN